MGVARREQLAWGQGPAVSTESSLVSTMMAYVSGGRVATQDTPSPSPHTLGPCLAKNIQPQLKYRGSISSSFLHTKCFLRLFIFDCTGSLSLRGSLVAVSGDCSTAVCRLIHGGFSCGAQALDVVFSTCGVWAQFIPYTLRQHLPFKR